MLILCYVMSFIWLLLSLFLSKFMAENTLSPGSLHRFTCYTDILNLQLSQLNNVCQHLAVDVRKFTYHRISICVYSDTLL